MDDIAAPLECRSLSPELCEPLAAFFDVLRNAGDDRHFHPHRLDDEEAMKLANYTGDDLYYVLVEGDKVLGYGMLRGWDQGYDIPSLGIAVHPSVRGTGLGGILVNFLHAAARRRGVTRVRLKVHGDNTQALKLYENLGYSFEGEEAGQLLGTIELR